ncbi:MAG TPA: peptidylprolyl isomerase [Limnobacter sp.]|nr:peptidylprolyl isomerase [Limnobacter sp.]
MKHIQLWIAALATLAAMGTAQAQNLKAPGKSQTLGKMSAQLGTGGGAVDDASAIDGIAAVVNTDIITRSELNRQVAMIERQMTRRGAPLPDRQELRKQVLERMVMDRAQLQQAEQSGIRIEDAQVEGAMARVAEQNGLTLDAFLARLQEEGVPASRFREEVRNEMTLARLREREVDQRIQVSDAEIQTFLASRTKSAPSRPEVNWIQLFVKVPENAPADQLGQARTKVQSLEKALRDGKTAEEILKTNPELAIEGTGAMGWSGFDAVPSLFTEFLSKANDNTVNTIRSPNGFHVLKVLGRRDAGAALDSTPVVQTRARHILIRTSPDVSEAEAKRRLNFVLEQLRGGQTDFETLAKRYSVDGSASKGGDLGWLYQGDTVPEFEREMNRLQPGEVSGIFESRFGFHVLQVIERRQQAASEERQRQAARQAIRANKSEESYQEWLRLLRDRTYVDIRL